MGIDMPSALVIVGILGTICTAIVKVVPRRENGVANGNVKFVYKDVCSAIHEGLNASLDRLEKNIGEVNADVKRLLEHVGRAGAK